MTVPAHIAIDEARFSGIDPAASDTARMFSIPCDYLRPDATGSWVVYRRETDGFGQLFPRPTAAEAERFYDVADYYTHSTGDADGAASESLFWKVLCHLAWRRDGSIHLDDRWWDAQLGNAPHKIVEIGCGNGEMLGRLKSMGHDVVGVEPDLEAVTVSASRGLRVLNGTAEKLPPEIADDRFDVVLMLHVLEHTRDPALALKHAKSLLNSDGLIVVEVPNNDCYGARRFGAIWNWLDAPRHLNFFTIRSLSNALEATGFAIERIEPYGYLRQFTSAWADLQTRIAVAFSLAPPRPHAYLAQFAMTSFASVSRKYDSIRIVARSLNGRTEG